jgi:hypothetical protein
MNREQACVDCILLLMEDIDLMENALSKGLHTTGFQDPHIKV